MRRREYLSADRSAHRPIREPIQRAATRFRGDTRVPSPENGSSLYPDGSLPVTLRATSLAIAVAICACSSGSAGSSSLSAVGVGKPCIPSDERQDTFSGFDVTEVVVDVPADGCETNLCLVNHFQGRTTCPYGQSEADARGTSQTPEELLCHVPGTAERVKVPVLRQFTGRKSIDTVYCSCQCSGPDPNGSYCECPTGFACAKLAGAYAYCVKSGTEYNPTSVNVGLPCSLTQLSPPSGNCGNPDGT
jgi:hypothetical protein